jgi:hypothetical protein
MPGSEKAATADPFHHHMTRWLDQMLHLVDVVLEDERIDRDIRTRVVRGILYGSPNPAEAEMRMAQQKQVARVLENRPPSLVVPREVADRLLGGGQS